MKYSITLSDVPPSLNKYLRMHFGAKKKLRERFGRDIAFALMAQGWRIPELPCHVPKMRVSALLFLPRRLDPENAYGSMKPVLDGMRDVRALRNDSPAWLELDVKQEISRVPRMEITIEEWREPCSLPFS